MKQLPSHIQIKSVFWEDTTGYEKRMFRAGDTIILSQPSSLHLYPNPTDNTLTVKD